MELTGVKQIDSFDSSEFLMETAQGWMLVQGKDLTLGKLDTERGDVVIKGLIENLSYVSNKKGSPKESFMSKKYLNNAFTSTDTGDFIFSFGRMGIWVYL